MNRSNKIFGVTIDLENLAFASGKPLVTGWAGG